MRSLGGVRLRHEVGEGPDRWVPPGSETGRGVGLSAAAARWEGRAACWARSAGAGPRSGPRREERGEEEQAAGEGREMGRARDREGEREFFSIFYFMSPFSFKTKHISKPNLNSF